MELKRPVLVYALLLGLAACSADDGTVTPAPPSVSAPNVVYDPTPGMIHLAPDDSLTLRVSVVPDQPFDVWFTQDDSVVTESPQFIVFGDETGDRRFRAIVHAGEFWFDDEWVVRVESAAPLPVPPPTLLGVQSGPLPGSILVRWERPPDATIDVPLRGYQIAWATSPFTVEQFDEQERLEVPDNRLSNRQSAVVERLAERERYYVRIRTVDQLARVSQATGQEEAESTGSFRVHGVVRILDANGWPVPVGNVAVRVQPADPVNTFEDGRYDFSSLPDLEPLVLTVSENSGLLSFPIRTSPLPPADRELPLLLVPRQSLTIRDEDGIETASDYRRFLLEATLNADGVGPWDFHPWPSYPVKVWVWEYTSPEGEMPQYHESFRRAIDLWNAGTTGDQRLVEYVPVDRSFDPLEHPGAVGVSMRLYEGISGNLGWVDFIRPVFGKLALDDPELLRITVRASIHTQAVADYVIAHELGHAIGLRHTPSVTNLMHATSTRAGGVPTPEELFVARYIQHGGEDMMANWLIDP